MPVLHMPINTEEAIRTAMDHHQAGRHSQAEITYRDLLSQSPDQSTILNLLGVLCVQTRRYPEAIDLLRRACDLSPTVANYHCNLGEALRRDDQLEESVTACREAIRLKPDLAVAHNNLGIALAALNLSDDAIAAYQKAIALSPNYSEAYANLSNILRQSDDLGGAISASREAIRLKPADAEAHNGFGAALAKKGLFDGAIAEYLTAIRLNPRHAEAHSNLGNSLAATGRIDEALGACDVAVGLDPDSVRGHWNLAIALLRRGDFRRGWEEHEWRLRWKNAAKRFDQPQWAGSDPHGKTILIHAEQGFGDTLQFLRYVPFISKMGCQVILECQPPLTRLLRSSGIEHIIEIGDALPHFDEHIPLMSIPFALSKWMNFIPSKIPYIHVDPLTIEKWKHIREPGHFQVGLCWSGNPGHSNDAHRSMALSELTSLAMPGIALHSMRINPKMEPFDLVEHCMDLTDFAETAGLIANLDLVITVDTAVAHLAAAIGKPTWIMLPLVADWRWMAGREDSIWYPTVKLFRAGSIQRLERSYQESEKFVD